MAEWSVYFEASVPGRTLTEEDAEEVLEALKRNHPSVTYGASAISARFCVKADSPARAVVSGLRALGSSLRAAGIKSHDYLVSGAEIQSLKDLDKKLMEPNIPELIGVAELAGILKVSKQRASELAHVRNFPRPIAELASGPVWKKGALARFIELWPRRPGRPKKKVVASA
ncbi:MAG: hypothetical protein HYT86_00225 [candidate division NC10 bacterium]|nr:hypothetical protein [candidate division NC10 bacterium]